MKLELIGKGLFSKVYRLNEKQVLIKSVCNVKECISMNWHSSTGVFPVLNRVDSGEYECEYYEKVTSVKDSLCHAHYEVYKELRGLSIDINTKPCNYYQEWYKAFKKVSNKKYREALLDMVDNLTNYGTDLRFEISPRNIAIKNGKLILLDVFFFASQANEARKKSSSNKMYC